MPSGGIKQFDWNDIVELVRQAADAALITDDPNAWTLLWIREIVDRSCEMDARLTPTSTKEALAVAMIAAVSRSKGVMAARVGDKEGDCPYEDLPLLQELDPLLPFRRSNWLSGWRSVQAQKPKPYGTEGYATRRLAVLENTVFQNMAARISQQYQGFAEQLDTVVDGIAKTINTRSKLDPSKVRQESRYATDFCPGFVVSYRVTSESIVLEQLRITEQANLM